MAESRQHRELVTWIGSYVKKHFSFESIILDDQNFPGDLRPPPIGFPAREPDVFAKDTRQQLYFIGEAKTDEDSLTKRSTIQYRSWLGFLENKQRGIFLVAVPGFSSNEVRFKIQDLCYELRIVNTEVMLWDSLDMWALENLSETQHRWHCT